MYQTYNKKAKKVNTYRYEIGNRVLNRNPGQIRSREMADDIYTKRKDTNISYKEN